MGNLGLQQENFGRPWHPEEDRLVLAGQPVEGRTSRAVQWRRQRLGVAVAPSVTRPADPVAYQQRREPPAWWARAFALNKQGYGCKAIAKRLGKSVGGVQYALHENHRQRSRARPASTTANRLPRDHKWEKTRKYAREQWEAENRTKPLASYYAKYECE